MAELSNIQNFQSDNDLATTGTFTINTLIKMFEVWGLAKPQYLAHFLGQCSVESGNFTKGVESLYYKTLPTHFDNLNKHPDPKSYLRNSEKMANLVYANRGGNGDEASGDGYRFRGRGVIQTTLRDQYQALASKIGDVEIFINPDVVATKYYWESGIFYFNNNKIWNYCDTMDSSKIYNVSSLINRGSIGKKPLHPQEREEQTRRFYSLIQTVQKKHNFELKPIEFNFQAQLSRKLNNGNNTF